MGKRDRNQQQAAPQAPAQESPVEETAAASDDASDVVFDIPETDAPAAEREATEPAEPEPTAPSEQDEALRAIENDPALDTEAEEALRDGDDEDEDEDGEEVHTLRERLAQMGFPADTIILAKGTTLLLNGSPVTLPVDVPVVLPGAADEAVFAAVLVRDRANFDLNKGSLVHSYNPLTGTRIADGPAESQLAKRTPAK